MSPFCVLQAYGVSISSSGWVSTVISSAGDITLGSPSGKSMAGTVQGLWVVPALVDFSTAGQTLPDVLASITAPAGTVAPTVSLQVQTAAPVVGTPVSVAVSATAAAGSTIRARVTFWGAAPRWAAKMHLACRRMHVLLGMLAVIRWQKQA